MCYRMSALPYRFSLHEPQPFAASDGAALTLAERFYR